MSRADRRLSRSTCPGLRRWWSLRGNAPDRAVAAAGGRKKGFLGLEYLLFAEAGSDSPAPVLAEEDAAPARRALALAMAHEIRKLCAAAERRLAAERRKLRSRARARRTSAVALSDAAGRGQ